MEFCIGTNRRVIVKKYDDDFIIIIIEEIGSEMKNLKFTTKRFVASVLRFNAYFFLILVSSGCVYIFFYNTKKRKSLCGFRWAQLVSFESYIDQNVTKLLAEQDGIAFRVHIGGGLDTTV
jgi:hypothetical protein